MSSSVLYHGFDVRGFKYLRTEYREGKIFFHIRRAAGKVACVACGSKEVTKKGRIRRVLRTVPIGQKAVYLVVHLHRLLCSRCWSLKQEPLPLSLPKKHWTKALGRYILQLLNHATIEDVARHLGMSWDTIKDIHRWALKRKFKRRRIRHLRYLAVDEVAVRKGHNYLTVVLDHDTGQVVWVTEGRETESLEHFILRLKRARVPIKAIAMDMWPAYIRAVRNHYPASVIVFDHYHIIADCNKMLDELRRKEAAGSPEPLNKFFKGSRYLLLKGAEKLESNSQARQKLDRLLDLNTNLSIGYILKEELRALWNCPSYRHAWLYLNAWLEKAFASNIELVQRFAKKIALHGTGILNYFFHHISTGKVEGTNNKIKVLKRKAYGFRDMEYLKLRIYFIHESRYALIG